MKLKEVFLKYDWDSETQSRCSSPEQVFYHDVIIINTEMTTGTWKSNTTVNSRACE